MNNKKTINPPINPGISLLIVVFLVLCLFTFSAITLTTSTNEYKRSKTLANNTREYYKAENYAQRELLSIAESVKKNNSYTISSQVNLSYDINEYEKLDITLEPLSYPVENKYFAITKWQIVNTKTWETKDTMQLLIP